MHVDINRLKGKTVEKGFTGEKMASELGIDQSTYYRKLGDGAAHLPSIRQSESRRFCL